MKKAKKVISIVAATTLILSLSATALAAGGNGGGGNSNTEKPSQAGPQAQCKGMMGPGGQSAADGSGFNGRGNCGQHSLLESAIANLSDDDAETLSDYIEAFEDAVAAEEAAREAAEEGDDLSSYREAVMEAERALIAAAEGEGIDLGLPERGQNGFGGRFGAPNALAEAIENLSDDDAETLSDYIEAFEDAVAAEEAARKAAEVGDDLSSYREAVMEAERALIAAAEDEGIDLGLPEKGQNGFGGGKFGVPNALAEAIENLSDDDAETLSDYIEAFEDAVTAEEAAREAAEEGDDLSQYHSAVMDALKELINAAKTEGISLDLPDNK